MKKMDSVVSNTQKDIGEEAKEVDDLNKDKLFRTSFADLHHDIFISILLRLPINSILTCKSVCKEWNTIISDPLFAQWHFECAPSNVFVREVAYKRVSRTLHLLDFEHKSTEDQDLVNDSDCAHVCSCKGSPHPYYSNHTKLEVRLKLPFRDSKTVLDGMLETRNEGRTKNFINCRKPKDDKFDVVNSCNGLLCLCDPEDRNPLVVCNPVTEEFIRLPEASKKVLLRDTYNCGFGYLKKDDSYKVIRICNRYVQRRGSEHLTYIHTIVEIHKLGSGSWRKTKYHTQWLGFRFPLCFNGSLHWLVSNHTGVSILCFDLESETFNVLPCPSPVSSMKERSEIREVSFGVVKGSLYICCPLQHCLTFWTMKTYGVGESWTQVLNFNTNWDYWRCYSFPWPTTCFVGAGILIYYPCRFLIYHEPQWHVFKSFEVRGVHDVDPIFYIPSLIKLKDVVKEDSAQVQNYHSRCATFKLREEEEEVLFMAKSRADLEDGLSDHVEEYSFLRSLANYR